jgi:hypothetical protein
MLYGARQDSWHGCYEFLFYIAVEAIAGLDVLTSKVQTSGCGAKIGGNATVFSVIK